MFKQLMKWTLLFCQGLLIGKMFVLGIFPYFTEMMTGWNQGMLDKANQLIFLVFLACGISMAGAGLRCIESGIEYMKQQRGGLAFSNFATALLLFGGEVWCSFSSRSWNVIMSPADKAIVGNVATVWNPSLMVASIVLSLAIIGLGLSGHMRVSKPGETLPPDDGAKQDGEDGDTYSQMEVKASKGAGKIPKNAAVNLATGKFTLGNRLDTGEAVEASIEDLMSTGIIGKPGRGKSSAERYLARQFLQLGVELVSWDPHGGMRKLAKSFDCFDTPEEFRRSAGDVERELHRRKAALKTDSDTIFQPMVLMVDELPVIADSCPEAMTTMRHVVLEGRKYGMYAVIAGQGMPAKLFDGSMTRDMLTSRIIFESTQAHAKMAGLDGAAAKNLMPQLRGRKGIAIVDVASQSDPVIVEIPYTTVDDVLQVAPARKSDPIPFIRPDDIPEQERAAIIRLHRQGTPRSQICAAMGKSNRYYPMVKHVLDEELALVA